MKTSEVIKRISECEKLPPISKNDHGIVAQIFAKAANEKKSFLNSGYQEELEENPPVLPPLENIFPLF